MEKTVAQIITEREYQARYLANMLDSLAQLDAWECPECGAHFTGSYEVFGGYVCEETEEGTREYMRCPECGAEFSEGCPDSRYQITFDDFFEGNLWHLAVTREGGEVAGARFRLGIDNPECWIEIDGDSGRVVFYLRDHEVSAALDEYTCGYLLEGAAALTPDEVEER